MKTVRKIFCCAVLFSALAAGSAAPPAPVAPPVPTATAEPRPAPAPILVGVVGPLSGTSAPSGLGQLNAVRLAVEEANADGGVGGRSIQVLSEDDRSRPDISQAAVERLMDQGCAAILGAVNSSCTRVDMAACARREVPLITSTSTASRLTAVGNKWIFRCIESDSSRMLELGRYMVEQLGVERIGILYDDDEFGRGLRDDLAESLGRLKKTFAFVGRFTRGCPDFTPLLQEARRKGVEALGLCGVTADNVRIAAQAQAAGYDFKLFSPDVNEQYQAAAEATESLVATDTFYSSRERKDFKDFIERYRRRFGHEASPYAGRAYDAARILIAALRKADPPSGQSLREALLDTNHFLGLTGDFNFKPNGDVIKTIAIVAIHGGKIVPVSEVAWSNRQRYFLLILIPLLLAVSGLIFWSFSHVRRAVRQKAARRPETAFAPIRTNPYIVGNPIREKEMFFGREDDFQFIRKNLERKDSGVCIVLCGERRSGKTSILYQVLNGRLGDRFQPVLIDLQLYGNVVDDFDFYTRMAVEIADSMRKRGVPLPDIEGEGRRRVERILDELIGGPNGRNVLLLFDEYEILETLIENGALHRATIDYLSGILEKYPAVSCILTGSVRLEERKAACWKQLIGKSLYRKISFLTRSDALRLIQEPLGDAVRYGEGVPERIWRLTAGQPFYTQAVCMNMVDHLNDTASNRPSAEDLAAVVDQLVENPLPQMLYFWDSFGYEQKLCLSLLAETLVGDEDWADPLALQQHAVSIEFPEPPEIDTVSMALEGLFAREVLTRAADGFQFRMDLLRPWILRDHSPWQVLAEADH